MKINHVFLNLLGTSSLLFGASTETLFQQGMQASKSGNAEQAVIHFRKARKQSQSPRINLELALAEEQLGNSKKAERLYREVLASNPPASVKENIQKRLQVVALAKKNGVERKLVKTETGETRKVTIIKEKNWSGDFTLGLFYDDNVNAGPTSDSVLIFDLPFVLSPDAQAQEDAGYQLKANYRYTHTKHQDLSVVSSLNYSRTGYFDNRRFDYDGLRLAVTPQWRLSNESSLSLPVAYSINWLGNELYTQGASISPTYQKRINQSWLSTSNIYVSHNSNAQVSGRDGQSLALSQSFRWTSKDGRFFIQPRIFYGQEFTDSDTLSSKQGGFGLGAYMAKLPGDVSLYIEPSIRYTEYNAVDPLVGKAREGTQFTVNVNATRQLPWWDMDVALGYTFTKNSSNVDLYDYQRNQFTLMLRKEF